MVQARLTVAYFGPVSYFSVIAGSESVLIEGFENYERQSWRNRCRVAAANGPIELTVPIIHGHSPGMPVKEVQIDSSISWQKNHQKTIDSAYRNSPYYDFFVDKLLLCWQKPHKFLFDLDLMILDIVCEIVGLSQKIEITDEFTIPGTCENDFRYTLHPKKENPDQSFKPPSYYQVFSERHPFMPDLSILDAIFCLGPDTSEYLLSCRDL